MLKTSVVIPTKNGERDIGDCLKAIFGQAYQEDFEVIVIDSGSRDNTLAIVERFPVRLFRIKPEEFHHAKTRNYGAELARGDYVVFLNQDAVPQGNLWLKTLTDNLEEPKVAGVGGRQVPQDNALPMERHWLNYFYDTKKKTINLPQGVNLASVHHYDFFSTVNAAIKRDVLMKFRFPDNVIMSEDKAWCRKALRSGYTVVYEPKAVVCHSHNYTLKTVFQRFFDSGMSYSQFCEHSNEFSLLAFVREGINYFGHEMFFLLRNGYIKYIPYAIIYDMMKSSGRALGENYRYLPKSINQKLCHHKEIYKRLVSM